MNTDIRTTPTAILINELCNEEEVGNQKEINNIAYELAYRLYVPNDTVTFEDLLVKFGYKRIERHQKKLELRNKTR